MAFDLFGDATDKAMDKEFDKKDPTIDELMEIASPKEKALLEALIAKCEDGEKSKDETNNVSKRDDKDPKGSKAPPFAKE